MPWVKFRVRQMFQKFDINKSSDLNRIPGIVLKKCTTNYLCYLEEYKRINDTVYRVGQM